ncbi:MAG TPA: MBL fold metallo-hydrolase, partial [Reyranella sp.]|nr:MBL fold metallo-hydrolase [Reyranella sp.]
MGPGFPAKDFFPEFDAETFEAEQHWLAPNYYQPESGRVIASIHSWLVRTGKHTVLIDSCSGNHKSRPGMPRFDMLDTRYLDRLRETG